MMSQALGTSFIGMQLRCACFSSFGTSRSHSSCEVFWKSSGGRYVKAVANSIRLLSPEIKVKCIKISIPRASGLEFETFSPL